ncbi:hypothetical protein AC578_5934 [Pseudocercospora eumusae]|uniref:Uncharacterized protein n=1 Tax=Pseudocercospora eumusae TaxID=321146 RepID=A0A139HIF5_9PEZI|nr:hypothetical protein AC578_5934 [Pseudocercospora eumusae]
MMRCSLRCQKPASIVDQLTTLAVSAQNNLGVGAVVHCSCNERSHLLRSIAVAAGKKPEDVCCVIDLWLR